jgi:hypothetical protein
MDAAGINEDCRKSAATSNDFTNDPCRRRQRRSNDAYRNVAASFNDFINDACRSLPTMAERSSPQLCRTLERTGQRWPAQDINEKSTKAAANLPQRLTIHL